MAEMLIRTSLKVTSAGLENIKRQLRSKIKRKAKELGQLILVSLFESPEISSFSNFLGTEQFAADFGIDVGLARDIEQKFRDIFLNETIFSLHSKIIETQNGFRLSLLDENYLRRITSHNWDSLGGKNKKRRRILEVNAWDIYEYGIIGSVNTGGLIRGFTDRINLNQVDQTYSRSGISLMKKDSGNTFSFFTGNAPRINTVRSFLATNIGKIEKTAALLLSKSR